MKHKFTTDECKRGGKKSASLASIYRRANPTPLEALTREAVSLLCPDLLELEYQIDSDIAKDIHQYLDIYFEINCNQCAIEVDGSHSWHYAGKMESYDELKAQYCKRHNIVLIYVQSRWINNHTAIELSDWLKTQIHGIIS
ncbi:MAG: hypothetical protein A2W22_03145 [Candidatus Levybacteria bacterium RBG_16_35_11]|nr:MAG: hypothetical protein A2W22_03145 [Candidatus Levybacteria bacterium RBG_16_35_11]